MGKLVCPNCEPTDPPKGPGYYPSVTVHRRVTSMAEVRADGATLRYEERDSKILYAECDKCGETLVDNRDPRVK